MGRELSQQQYHVHEWGGGFFDIDEGGYACVSPEPGSSPVRLATIVDALRKRGYRSPFVIRFPQILKSRVSRLHTAFQSAIEEFDYPEHFQGVYPVKVNQQRSVLDALVEESARYGYGLEIGSKGELVLALIQELDPKAYIVCNGFKDRDYIELALRGEKAGSRVLLICETEAEVADVIKVALEVGVVPRIGFRVRLHSTGAGRWVESGGHHAKFGLSSFEILSCVALLNEAGFDESLQCLHFHVGSQICDILAIKDAVKEAARIYCHIQRRAKALHILDLGGGLGVDYDGSKTASEWSQNYSLEEYCRDCVWNILAVCQEEDVRPPRLLSESGRAVTAFGTMVVVSPVKVIGRVDGDPLRVSDDASRQVRELVDTLDDMTAENWRDLVHDAKALSEEVILGFKMGFVSFEDRAAAEALYADVCRRALEHLDPDEEHPEEVSELMRTSAPMIICNFSVFQSVPDTWAVRQVFPVMPLSHLADECRHPYTLGDITCDSDGRIEDFLGPSGSCQKTIQLPLLDLKNPYLIGVFLVGAYQDTLGDFHNLFGSANEVAAYLGENGEFELSAGSRGTTVSEAVSMFGFPREELLHRFEDQHGGEDSVEVIRYRDCFLRVLSSGTYLRR